MCLTLRTRNQFELGGREIHSINTCSCIPKRLNDSLLRNGEAEFVDWRSFFAQNLPRVLPCAKVCKVEATSYATIEAIYRKWEDVDHDAVNSVAGALTSTQGDAESDPLGLRRGSIAEWVRHWFLSLQQHGSSTWLSLNNLDMEASMLFPSYVHDPSLTFHDHRGINPYIFQIIRSQGISFSLSSQRHVSRSVGGNSTPQGLHRLPRRSHSNPCRRQLWPVRRS